MKKAVKKKEAKESWREEWFVEVSAALFGLFVALLVFPSSLFVTSIPALQGIVLFLGEYISPGLYVSYLLFLLIASFVFALFSWYGSVKVRKKISAFPMFSVALAVLSFILLIFILWVLVSGGAQYWIK